YVRGEELVAIEGGRFGETISRVDRYGGGQRDVGIGQAAPYPHQVPLHAELDLLLAAPESPAAGRLHRHAVEHPRFVELDQVGRTDDPFVHQDRQGPLSLEGLVAADLVGAERSLE